MSARAQGDRAEWDPAIPKPVACSIFMGTFQDRRKVNPTDFRVVRFTFRSWQLIAHRVRDYLLVVPE